MKKLALLIYFSLFAFHCSFAQGTWTWIKGDSIGFKYSSVAIYGIQGIPSPLNTPQVAYEAAEWTDLQGNFWLFSCHSFADFWKYDPSTNNWTWIKGTGLQNDTGSFGIKGVPSVTNRPSARRYTSATWTDLNGDLWLFGGYGAGIAGNLDDLWRYNIATNTWTWINGTKARNLVPVYGTKGIPAATNTPGGICEAAATWVDAAGNLWFYGGNGNTKTSNVLWKYDIGLNQWVWMHGSNNPSTSGAMYGVIGVPSPANTPGYRYAHCTWTDSQGNFWLFGGGEIGRTFNDLWKYEVATNEWAWMGGKATTKDTGLVGPTCIPGMQYLPSCRLETRARWVDDCGRFWLFGGLGAKSGEIRDDIWCLNPANLEWAHIKGSISSHVPPAYGIKGVPNITNDPGGRGGSVCWKGKNGEVFIFGGASISGFRRNDIWRFTPDSTCTALNSPSISINLGKDTTYCGSFSRKLYSGNAGSFWSTGIYASQITITTPGKYWATVYSCGVPMSDTITITQSPFPVAGNISSNKDSICAGTALTSTFTSAGSTGSIQWQESTNGILFNDIPGATNSTYTTPAGLLQTTYYRTIAHLGSCYDTSATSTLHIIPNPSVTFTPWVNGNEVTFTSSTTGSVQYYEWNFGDSTFSHLPNPMHTYAGADTFHVCVTVYNASNCSFTYCSDVITGITSIQALSKSAVKIYPNPVNDKLVVENYSENISLLEITDLVGRKLLEQVPNSNQAILDLSSFTPGVYFLRVTCGGQSGTYKVVHY